MTNNDIFNLDETKKVRGAKVHIGDVYYISSNIINTRHLKPGSFLTYDSAYSTFVNLIDTSYQKITGEFQVVSIIKDRKHWWQFWKSNQIKNAMIKCIKL